VTRKIKQLEVEGHVSECPIAGDANEKQRQINREYTSNKQNKQKQLWCHSFSHLQKV